MRTNSIILVISFFLFLFGSCIQEYVVNNNDTPKENIQLLWNIVNENYCYFEEKEVDWQKCKFEYVEQVNNSTSEKELFEICSNMLSELRDGHVNLYSNFNTFRYWDWFLDYPQNFNWSIVERNYLGKDYIIAGRLKARKIKNIGYLRYESFTHEITLDNIYEAIKQLGEINGLIIDVRDNGGGNLDFVDKFASCFFSEKTLVGYLKYKEGPKHDDFSDFFPLYLEPERDVAFHGQISILTNRLVYSATNDFVSKMKNLPNVTVIGDVTGGGGGAPFSSELYNGWEVRISRDPVFNVQKESIEAGIAPDILVSITPEDEQNGVDTIIEFAIDYLLNH